MYETEGGGGGGDGGASPSPFPRSLLLTRLAISLLENGITEVSRVDETQRSGGRGDDDKTRTRTLNMQNALEDYRHHTEETTPITERNNNTTQQQQNWQKSGNVMSPIRFV